MTAQRLCPATRAHLLLVLVDIEQALAGTANLEALALIERAPFDLRQDWPEAAHDALQRARKLLQTSTEGTPR